MFENLSWTDSNRHIAEDDLLLYADGELSPRKAAKVHKHLESCWPCRVRVEKYQQIIFQLVDYVNLDLAANLPRPPNSWGSFTTQLRELANEPYPRPGILGSLTALARNVFGRRELLYLASGVALLLLLFGVFKPFVARPVAPGSELLRNSTTAEKQSLSRVVRPVIYQKLTIRTGHKSFVREIWRDAANHRSKDN